MSMSTISRARVSVRALVARRASELAGVSFFFPLSS